MSLPSELVASLLSAGAVLSFALYLRPLIWSRRPLRKRVERFTRLEADERSAPGPERWRAVADVERTARDPLSRALGRDIAAARLKLSVPQLLAIAAGLSVAAFAVVDVASGRTPLAIGAAIAGAAAPLWWVRSRSRRFVRAFTDQLPDTVATISNTVRAGSSLPQALQRIAREAPEPTRSAFATLAREIGLGMSVEEALQIILRAYPSEDLEVAVLAIEVQYQVGGSLTKVLDTLVETMRERRRLVGDMTALTSQQRYTATLLAGLPLFAAIFLSLVSPDYIGELFEEGPLRIAVVADVILTAAGFLIMQEVARVDV